MRVPTIEELTKMVEEAKTNPKRKRRKSGSSWGGRRNSKRTNYAAQVITRGGAMAELVGRVNGNPDPNRESELDPDNIPFLAELSTVWPINEAADWRVRP